MDVVAVRRGKQAVRWAGHGGRRLVVAVAMQQRRVFARVSLAESSTDEERRATKEEDSLEEHHRAWVDELVHYVETFDD